MCTTLWLIGAILKFIGAAGDLPKAEAPPSSAGVEAGTKRRSADHQRVGNAPQSKAAQNNARGRSPARGKIAVWEVAFKFTRADAAVGVEAMLR
jgi:hypothetical protein